MLFYSNILENTDVRAYKWYYIFFIFAKDDRELPLPSPLRPEAVCQAQMYQGLIVMLVVSIFPLLFTFWGFWGDYSEGEEGAPPRLPLPPLIRPVFCILCRLY